MCRAAGCAREIIHGEKDKHAGNESFVVVVVCVQPLLLFAIPAFVGCIRVCQSDSLFSLSLPYTHALTHILFFGQFGAEGKQSKCSFSLVYEREKTLVCKT